MRVKALGCYGNQAVGYSTTAFLLDDCALLDGGTITSALTQQELDRVDYILLSHAHLDHIKEIPFLLSSQLGRRDKPIVLASTEYVQLALKTHIFNNEIWPNLTNVPTGKSPILKFQTLKIEEPTEVGPYIITAVEVNHTVPTAGFIIEKPAEYKTIIYSGDTTSTDRLWELGRSRSINGVICELAFPTRLNNKALTTKHLTPPMLKAELEKLRIKNQPVLLYHMRPEFLDEIANEIGLLPYRLIFAKQGNAYEF